MRLIVDDGISNIFNLKKGIITVYNNKGNIAIYADIGIIIHYTTQQKINTDERYTFEANAMLSTIMVEHSIDITEENDNIVLSYTFSEGMKWEDNLIRLKKSSSYFEPAHTEQWIVKDINTFKTLIRMLLTFDAISSFQNVPVGMISFRQNKFFTTTEFTQLSGDFELGIDCDIMLQYLILMKPFMNKIVSYQIAENYIIFLLADNSNIYIPFIKAENNSMDSVLGPLDNFTEYKISALAYKFIATSIGALSDVDNTNLVFNDGALGFTFTDGIQVQIKTLSKGKYIDIKAKVLKEVLSLTRDNQDNMPVYFALGQNYFQIKIGNLILTEAHNLLGEL